MCIDVTRPMIIVINVFSQTRAMMTKAKYKFARNSEATLIAVYFFPRLVYVCLCGSFEAEQNLLAFNYLKVK